jgi:hypothetical protein
VINLVLVHDAHTDRWSRLDGPLPVGGVFNDPGVAVLGDTLYVAGGEGPLGSHFRHFLSGHLRPAR